MNGKYIIRANESGWVVYPAGNPDNFRLFRSDEPARFVKFIAEKIGGIKVDQIVESRLTERADAARRMEEAQ